MLHELLAAYLDGVERTIRRCRPVYVEHYVEEVLTPERINLRLRLRFEQGHMLEISEAVVIEDNRLVSLDYRYHCQDASNRLLFRYDCTPHFPELENVPHHKHVPGGVLPSPKPDTEEAIREAGEIEP